MSLTVVSDWRTVPSPPTPALHALQHLQDCRGQWRGTLLAQREQMPVVLLIAFDGRGALAVGEGPPKPISDLGLVDGLLSGDTHGDIGGADTRRDRLDQLALSLKRRGDRMERQPELALAYD